MNTRVRVGGGRMIGRARQRGEKQDSRISGRLPRRQFQLPQLARRARRGPTLSGAAQLPRPAVWRAARHRSEVTPPPQDGGPILRATSAPPCHRSRWGRCGKGAPPRRSPPGEIIREKPGTRRGSARLGRRHVEPPPNGNYSSAKTYSMPPLAVSLPSSANAPTAPRAAVGSSVDRSPATTKPDQPPMPDITATYCLPSGPV